MSRAEDGGVHGELEEDLDLVRDRERAVRGSRARRARAAAASDLCRGGEEERAPARRRVFLPFSRRGPLVGELRAAMRAACSRLARSLASLQLALQRSSASSSGTG